MIHEILPVGPLQCNCSIFGDETTRQAIVIDPGDNIDEIVALLAKHSLTVHAIIITHAHIDHIGGAARLKKKLNKVPGAPVLMNSLDADLYAHLDLQAGWLGIETPERTSIDSDARDGDTVSLGDESPTQFQILHTPGHTQGSISVWIPSENKLLAGDTLFRDSIGRTDLPGGDSRQILASIKNKLLPLPEETIVVPGHGPNTTIGREKERNPFLRRL